MAADLTPTDVAGVLDQIYRVSAGGLPRRFHLLSEQLRDFAARRRSLRPEFFDQTAFELECRYSILMSYPRLGSGGVLGFASCRLADGWPAATDDHLRDLLRSSLGPDWGQSVRSRLRQLYELSRPGPSFGQPVLISEQQLCQLAEQQNFRESWWSDLMDQLTKAAADDRLVFFRQGGRGDRTFAVTHEEHIKTWYAAKQSDWAAAQKRYDLDEVG